MTRDLGPEGDEDPRDDELLLDNHIDETIVTPPGDLEADNDDDAESGDDVVIGFDDEEDPTPPEGVSNPHLLQNLRDELRRTQKELRDARKAAPVAPPAPAVKIDPGPRPTLEDAEYDEAKHGEMLDAWIEKREQAKAQQSQVEREQERSNDAWQATLKTYEAKKTALARPDYQEAEDAFVTAIDPVRQAIIVRGASDPAKAIYALGRSPVKLAEIAKITDPIAFAFAVAKLEGKIVERKSTRTPPPPPEQIARGSAPLSQSAGDKRLAELEKRAEKSNDRTELIRYKREMREKAR